MKDKEKQIEEMAKRIHIATNLYYIECIKIATYLFEKDNCRIIDKDSVVLSREEINNADYFYVKDGELIPVEKGRGKFITNEWYKELLMKMPLEHELAKERKETAERDFCTIIKALETKKASIMMHYGVAESVGADVAIRTVKELAKQLGVKIKE